MENFNHYYAGSNSPRGFVNCFGNLVNDENSFTYILKGGPGTGKSSLLKRLAASLTQFGVYVECLHCSLDFDSLDGVVLPEHGIVILDGTSPHPKDVDILGISDKIINLGAFLSNDVYNYRDKIKKLTKLKSAELKLAGDYFTSALGFYLAEKKQCSINYDKSQAERIMNALPFDFETETQCSEEKHVRKLFNRSLSDDGGIIEQFVPSIKTVEIECEESSVDVILRLVVKKLGNKSIIEFLNPLCPDDIQSVYLPQTKTLFKAKSFKKSFESQSMDACLVEGRKHLQIAKDFHTQIEAFYIANMDFNALGVEGEKLLKDILDMINRKKTQ